ncbi:MAG: LPXTG cell wall anchor domain-containing protein [Dehalococcoidia bacterium]|nr:LPXTG cell wall anchor domain-containing protein [Dehalococcoidia bacterium]
MTLTHSRWVAALVASAGAVILATGLFGATTGLALPDYTAKTGQACGICHVNPVGAGALTARGTAFAAIATHSSDPAGAFAQSGTAAPAATATTAPAPAATPTAAPKPAATAAPAATTAPAAAATTAPAATATAAPAKPAASPTVAAAATPSSLPKTGGELPLAPLAMGAGVFLSALGLSVRRIFRR